MDINMKKILSVGYLMPRFSIYQHRDLEIAEKNEKDFDSYPYKHGYAYVLNGTRYVVYINPVFYRRPNREWLILDRILQTKDIEYYFSNVKTLTLHPDKAVRSIFYRYLKACELLSQNEQVQAIDNRINQLVDEIKGLDKESQRKICNLLDCIIVDCCKYKIKYEIINNYVKNKFVIYSFTIHKSTTPEDILEKYKYVANSVYSWILEILDNGNPVKAVKNLTSKLKSG